MMRKNKLNYLIGFVLILILGSICNLIINRNFLCSGYEGKCCHDGRIEWIDKYFCEIHFKQIEYVLALFPENSNRCWKEKAEYISRRYSGKEDDHTSTSEDKKKTLYYLDQAIKYNPEDIDVLSWKAVFVGCPQSLKYKTRILNLLKSEYRIYLERVPNVYYNIIACKQEINATDIDFWENDFRDFCKDHSELNEDCERFMSYLKNDAKK
jgi:hypothetical protein